MTVVPTMRERVKFSQHPFGRIKKPEQLSEMVYCQLSKRYIGECEKSVLLLGSDVMPISVRFGMIGGARLR